MSGSVYPVMVEGDKTSFHGCSQPAGGDAILRAFWPRHAIEREVALEIVESLP